MRFAAATAWIALPALLSGCFADSSASPVVGLVESEIPDELPVPIAVEAAKIGPISSYYTATATLEVEKEAQILARVTGIVQSIAVEEDDEVEEGQELLRIENDEYRLRLGRAVANARNLQSQLERLEKIRAEDLISAEELDTARNDLATAKADEELARLELSYTTVRATFDGKIVRRYVDIGQNVSVGTPLFGLADFHPLLARIYVPSKEFNDLRLEQPVELVLDSSGERLKNGRIKLISPTIDPNTGTIKVTVEVPEYPKSVRPGDFAEVRVVTELRPNTTLVARNSVITDKGEQVVFVAAGNIAERRVVEVGFTDDYHAEVLSGVQPGDLVVVKGQRSLKHGARLKILEEQDLSRLSPSGLGS